MEQYFRQLSKLEPIDAGATPSYSRLPGIRAVLFDVYGTLIISSSGDLGNLSPNHSRAAHAFRECGATIDAQGKPLHRIEIQVVDLINHVVHQEHQRLRKTGIDYPEVDIVAVWRKVTDDLKAKEVVKLNSNFDFEKLAVVFEVLSNPSWPMPDMRRVLDWLSEKRVSLGVVSNAQFFTPRLLNYFLSGQPAGSDALVNDIFDNDLCFFSFQYQYAKPSLMLYQKASERLSERGIEPQEVLFVGNDMLKDIYPAKTVGFKAILFAGDKRSLRWREESPLAQSVKPDGIITSLSMIPEVLG